MIEAEHLARAPIVEALLDIGVVPSAAKAEDRLAEVQSRLGGQYPTKQIRKTWTGQLEFRPDAAPLAKGAEGPSALQLTSRDGKEVVQVRPNGFSYSRLQPYTDWVSFSASARAAWHEYAKLVEPQSVNRIALRYINRIPLPSPVSDLSDYLQTGPTFAPGLPQPPKAFFFRAVLADEISRSTVILTETVEEGKNDLSVPLILDIDVFRVGVFPVETEKLWALFPSLHEAKNRYFFNSITEATKELFR
jgi:uncharacterized protein (TIGR04255 family)